MSKVNIPALCFIYVTQIYGFLLLDKSEYNKESEIANNKLY